MGITQKSLRFIAILSASLLLSNCSNLDDTVTNTPSIKFWKTIYPGYDFTIAIRSYNTLWSWGNNEGGQLGDGTLSRPKNHNSCV